ncbi:hypothetical protein AK812_SmicGene25361 [Symbiodinium microadriaticum]|uniref:Endonuclease/exonuclease/phosphatase domain-containing protein n=1 Tax=Symbiodinium microadriaticum TaxID=2951 RepID=A0A1Q9DC93_SYMMI|nr:hypothetical protein AK812_SmicGene25361 [Symbiodinium microadriaticum]
MAFAVIPTLLPLLGVMTSVALSNDLEVLWPGGSQFPPLHHRTNREDAPDAGADPRVGPLTTMGPGTVPVGGAVKNSGETTGNAPLLTYAKKRAFRRARRRAEIKGGTMFKGRWCSAQELGTIFLSEGMPSVPVRRQRAVYAGWQATSRLKVRTYNIGGITSEVYDVLHRWLTSTCTDDVVVVQELHHGCGKTDHSWTIPGWTVAITADERNRFSGVGVFISHSYQCVWQGRHQEAVSANRSLFWGKLSALMQTLPTRNLVVVAMDANTHLQQTSIWNRFATLKVPRGSLAHSLRNAGAPEELIHAVMIRGRAAAKWIKQRQHRTPTGKVLDLGTPHVESPIKPSHVELIRSLMTAMEEAAQSQQAREDLLAIWGGRGEQKTDPMEEEGHKEAEEWDRKPKYRRDDQKGKGRCPWDGGKYAQGTVSTSLKSLMVLALVNDLKERVEAVLGKEDQLQKCQDLGWMVQTETALNPSWVYFGWDSAAKKQIVLPDPPLKHAECLRQIDTLLEHLPRDGVLARFSTPKALKKLSGCAAMPLEAAYLAAPFCDWTRRNNASTEDVGPSSVAAQEDVRLDAGTLGHAIILPIAGDRVAAPLFSEADLMSTMRPSR